MDLLKDPQMIQLFVLSIAFVVGIAVCIYVVIKESAELKRRRLAKRLMYADTVSQQTAHLKARQQRQMQAEQEPQPNRDTLAFN